MTQLLPFRAVELANSFGIRESDLTPRVSEYLKSREQIFFETISGSCRDVLITLIVEKILSDRQKIGSRERTKVWHDGWAENLIEFGVAKSHEEARKSLIPKFVRPGQPIRWQGRYCSFSDPCIEQTYIDLLRIVLIDHYFQDCEGIVEFGARKTLHRYRFCEVCRRLDKCGGR